MIHAYQEEPKGGKHKDAVVMLHPVLPSCHDSAAAWRLATILTMRLVVVVYETIMRARWLVCRRQVCMNHECG